MVIRGLYFFLLGLIISCSPKIQVDLLIKNASIISLESGEAIQSQVILINGGRIFTTGGDSLLLQFKGKTEIDAHSAFVLPGLWDNHVHFGGAEYID